MKVLFTLILLVISSYISLAQEKLLPRKIRISKGEFNIFFGNRELYNDKRYVNQIEYDLKEHQLRRRKNENKKFKKTSAVTIPDIFTDTSTYLKLDSIFDSFPNYERRGMKMKFYKIDILFYTGLGIPSKTKTIEFLYAPDGFWADENDRNLLEQIIDEYLKMISN